MEERWRIVLREEAEEVGEGEGRVETKCEIASWERRIGCVRFTSRVAKEAVSVDGPVWGGDQKLDHFWRDGVVSLAWLGIYGLKGGVKALTGSKIPAPGQKMSMVPKAAVPASTARSRSVHMATFVRWKMALGLDWCASIRAWASGRRARSAMRTLTPCESSRDANSKLIPEPAPVMRADWPASEEVIVEGWPMCMACL